MPPPIFEIDELMRLVIDYLVVMNPLSAVSFALTCRSLEEPTLSALWRQQQHLLIPLLRVLPQFTKEGDVYVIAGNPRPKDWDRLRRFASWMRHLSLYCGVTEVHDTVFQRLSSELPGEVLCPNLEQLDWGFGTARTPHSLHIFFPPSLKRVSINTNFRPDRLQYASEFISRLPDSLESFFFNTGHWSDGGLLMDLMTSFVLRCGSSLGSFGYRPPLSEAAFLHLMQLPNLRSWVAYHPPPQAFPLPTFPSLEKLTIERTALPWLHLLAACGQGKHSSAPASAIMNTNIKETLKVLTCPRGTAVDRRLLSSISSFRNLVTVYNYPCQSDCLFDLTDKDVENFAAALPSLVDLRLGGGCESNTCRTTVSSLLSISIHCLELKFLETHFNTHNIVEDMECLLDEGTGRGKPKCKLQSLSVGSLPLRVPEFANETLAVGFTDIFPCLEVFTSWNMETWERVGAKLRNRLTSSS